MLELTDKKEKKFIGRVLAKAWQIIKLITNILYGT